ncbi:MAG: TetR/AcrR family transcriptional regulator, partial [Nocardioides sp.]
MRRRDQILQEAARLFAASGFHGVSVADIGAACGISGPALYKHFVSKEAMLAQMLVAASEVLLAEGRARIAAHPTPAEALGALIEWHVGYALRERPLIVVQDRDWQSLAPEARVQVRDLQRAYVELWAGQLRTRDAGLDEATSRALAQAGFGLMNSTPRA